MHHRIMLLPSGISRHRGLPDGSGNSRMIGTIGSSVISRLILLLAWVGGAAVVPLAQAADTTPNSFEIPSRHAVRRNTPTSGSVVIRGLSAPAPVSVVNGSYEVYLQATGESQGALPTVNDGDMVVVSHNAALAYRTTTRSTLTIGGVSATFESTTLRHAALLHGRLVDLNGDDLSDLIAGAQACVRGPGDGLDCSSLDVPAPWVLTHTTDFDGDERSDLVWRNPTTGETAIWLMDGNAPRSSAIIVSDRNWMVRHVGDFDGDGRGDLVWFNSTTYEQVVWLMSGLTPHTSGTLDVPQVADGWRVQLVADFDGNGKSDIIWRNDTTLESAVWFMDGLRYERGSIVVVAPEPVAAAFVPANIGDFDDDGKDDLVWVNGTGQCAVWLMDGLALPFRAGARYGLWLWRESESADIDGDGKSDLLTYDGVTFRFIPTFMDGIAVVGDVRSNAIVLSKVVDWDGDGATDFVESYASGQPANYCRLHRLVASQFVTEAVKCGPLNLTGDPGSSPR